MKQVVAALILRAGRLLICQRARNDAMPLKWEFPGGKIEPGEDEESALRRELQEELGILATIGPKLTTIRHTYDHQASVELHFYLVEMFQGEIQNLIFEAVHWADLKELPKYDFLEADVAMVNDIASGRLRVTHD